MLCAPHQMFFRRSNEEEYDGWGMWHVWGRREVHIGLWWGDLRERRHFKGLGINGRKILKWALKLELDLEWIDLAHERDKWRAAVDTVINLGFHKLLGIS